MFISLGRRVVESEELTIWEGGGKRTRFLRKQRTMIYNMTYIT